MKRVTLAAVMGAMYLLRHRIGPPALLAFFLPGILVVVALYLAFVVWTAVRGSGTRSEVLRSVMFEALPMGTMLQKILRRGKHYEQR